MNRALRLARALAWKGDADPEPASPGSAGGVPGLAMLAQAFDHVLEVAFFIKDRRGHYVAVNQSQLARVFRSVVKLSPTRFRAKLRRRASQPAGLRKSNGEQILSLVGSPRNGIGRAILGQAETTLVAAGNDSDHRGKPKQYDHASDLGCRWKECYGSDLDQTETGWTGQLANKPHKTNRSEYVL